MHEDTHRKQGVHAVIQAKYMDGCSFHPIRTYSRRSNPLIQTKISPELSSGWTATSLNTKACTSCLLIVRAGGRDRCHWTRGGAEERESCGQRTEDGKTPAKIANARGGGFRKAFFVFSILQDQDLISGSREKGVGAKEPIKR